MNILPHKSWHVRNKENIAKVRKDEAEAAAKQNEEEQRAKLADQEARLLLMRKNVKINYDNTEKDVASCSIEDGKNSQSNLEVDIYTASGNINFFKDVEKGEKESGTNKEYEEEKKDEKESYEKKIGYLTYLGQDTLESEGKIAWYSEKERIVSQRKEISADDEGEADLKFKSKHDPIIDMKKYLGCSSFLKLETKPSSMNNIQNQASSKNLCRKDKKHDKKRSKHAHKSKKKLKKKDKKHKKKKKHKKALTSESELTEDEEEKNNKLKKLREERLKREAIERKRQIRLLEGKDPDGKDEIEPVLPHKQKYNSQFNPEIAKQNVAASDSKNTTLQTGVKYWLN